MKALFPCLILSSFAQDIPSLVEASKKAAQHYQEDAKGIAQQAKETAKSYQDDVSPIVEKAAQIQQDTIHQTDKVFHSGKSCRQSPDYSGKSERNEAPLKIFVSSSMPQESLKALHHQSQRIGARLVFRGLIHNSFKETQRYFKDMGISADIDPPAFEEQYITHVPTFVLIGKKSKTDRLQGNISLEEALSIMADKGELKSLAGQLKSDLGARP